MDPLSAGVSLLDAWLTRRQIDKWARLILSIGMSFFVTFNATMGGMLVAHNGFLVSLGTGMVVASGAALTRWMTSDLTRGKDMAVTVSHEATADPSQFETLSHK